MPNTIYNPLTGNFDYVIDDAAEIAYTPADPADWPVAPDDTKEALDSLANTVASLSVGAAPDATTTTKGIVKLAGDLGGTADLPTVPDMVKSVSNVGGGQGVYKTKDGYNIELKSITGSGSVAVSTVGDEINILGSGEANTASNVGGGNGIYKEKDGVDLKFKTITAGTGITVTSTTDTIDISSVAAAGVTIKDEGTTIVPTVTNINFVGDGVNTTTDGSGGAIVTIPGGGSTPNVYPILDAQTNTLLETITAKDKTYDITYSVNRSVLDTNALLFNEEFANYTYFQGTVTSSAFQSDGKLVVGLATGSIYGSARPLARFNTDGSLDVTFSNNIAFLPSASIFCIAIQSDGKILVGGSFTNYGGTAGKSRLIRLNSDGTEDTAFTTNAVANGPTARINLDVNSVAVQPDGKILIGGDFTNYNGVAGKSYLIRLNSDGTEDTTFSSTVVVNGTTARFNGEINSIAVNASTIVIGGNFTNYNTNTGRSYLAKFSLAGTYDTTFGANGIYNGTTARFNGPIYSVFIQSDGKVLVAGAFTLYNSVGNYNLGIRLQTTGSLDSTFSSFLGLGSTGIAYSTIQLSNGDVFFGGTFTLSARVFTDSGSLNTTFDANAFGLGNPSPDAAERKIFGTVRCAAEIPSIGIFIGGNIIGSQISEKVFQGAIHLSYLGIPTDFFNPSSFAHIPTPQSYLAIFRILKQPDGKYIAFGGFQRYKSWDCIVGLMRLNSDFSLDLPFMQNAVYTNATIPGNNPTANFSSYITDCKIQSDGKILVSGNFMIYKSQAGKNRLLRFNSDGTEDTTFSSNAIVTGTTANINGVVNVIALQPDGKILFGGNFTNYKSQTGKNNLIRLNSDGTEDTAFSANAVVNGTTARFGLVRDIKIQSDGKIVVAGDFANYSGQTGKSYLIRLNSDGTEDTAFSANAVVNGTTARLTGSVVSLSIQSDGKILLAGQFTNYFATGKNYLMRLNSNGTEDTAFSTNAIVTGTTAKISNNLSDVNCLISGKIIICGNFTSYNSQTGKDYVIRLNSDGTEDTVFNSKFVYSGSTPRFSGTYSTLGLVTYFRKFSIIDSAIFLSDMGKYSPYDPSVKMSGTIQLEEEIRSEIGTLLAKYNSTGYSYSTPNKIGSSAETGVTMSFNSDGTIKYTSTTLGNSSYAVDEIKIEKKEY